MILRNLRLENVRSYKDLSIEFGPGITTILGPNGAGKSTLLQAAAWGLLGLGSPAALRRHHAPFLRVALEFQAHGRDYRVVRERRFDKGGARGTNILYETTGGAERKLRWQDRDVTEEVVQITGLEPAVFQNAILVAQGEMDALTRATPAEREAMVARLLGIEEMERVWERMGPVASVFEREAEGLRAALGLAEGKRRGMEEARLRREELVRKVNGLEGNLASLRRREEETRAKWEAAEAKRREALQLREEAKHVEAEVRRSAEQEREAGVRLREVERAAAEAAPLAGAVKRLPLLESWEALLHDEKLLKERETHAARLREQVARAGEQARSLQGAHGEWVRLASEIEHFQKERDRFQAAGALAARAESDLRRSRERLASAEAELAAARKRLPFDDPAGLAEFHRARVEEATRGLRQAEEALAGAMEARTRAEVEEARLSRALRELEGVSGPCPLCSQPLSEQHRAEVLATYRGDLGNLREELKSGSQALQKARARVEALRRAREEEVRLPVEAWARAAREAEGLRAEIARVESEVSAAAGSRKALEGAEARLREARSRRAALEPKAAEYLAAQKLLEQTPDLSAAESEMANRRAALARRREEVCGDSGRSPPTRPRRLGTSGRRSGDSTASMGSSSRGPASRRPRSGPGGRGRRPKAGSATWRSGSLP